MSLHNHTTFSLLDGVGVPEEHARYAKQIGVPGVACTDHGNTAAWYKWESAFKKEGVNPLFGIESYFTDDRHKKHKETMTAHLLLLAKNQTGLKNINKIATAAALEGKYRYPRCDWELLREHHEGVICTTACVSGPPAEYVKKMDFGGARNWIAKAQNIFGDDLLFELQPHAIAEQKALNKFLLSMKGHRYIVTGDVHYPTPQHKPHHFVSVCMATKSTVNDPKMAYDFDLHMKSYEQLARELEMNHGMAEGVAGEAAEGSVSLCKTTVELPKGLPLLPTFEDAVSRFRASLQEGWDNKIVPHVKRSNHEEYRKRLEYESTLIEQKGFVEYFLVVMDMIKAAKEKVFVAPGRGSSAGSLVAYLLDITDADPILWDLSFERFLPTYRGGFKMELHDSKKVQEIKEWYLNERL